MAKILESTFDEILLASFAKSNNNDGYCINQDADLYDDCSNTSYQLAELSHK